jgi:hypothetical protein
VNGNGRAAGEMVRSPIEVRVSRGEEEVAPPAPVPGQPGMLFFGASRRSGTTWLASMLNGHPEISCRNEGWLLNDTAGSCEHWINREALRAWGTIDGPRGTYLAKMPIAEAIRAAHRGMVRELVLEAVRREGWKQVEKLRYMGDKTTQYYCTKVDVLHELFPDGRYIGMVRDGRDVVVSDFFLMCRDGKFDDLPESAREHARKAQQFHVLGKGEPTALFCEGSLRWFLDQWMRSIAGGERARELFGARYRQVRYEDVVADTAGTMRDVYAWLGVEASDALIERVIEQTAFEKLSGGRKRGEGDNRAEWRKGVAGDWVNYLTEDDKALVKSVAGTLLMELGYTRDMSW